MICHLEAFLEQSAIILMLKDEVFSKLKEQRFPGEIELKDLIGRRIPDTRIVDGPGGHLWS
ncbi:hypothetical protein U1Q18_046635 [Sarracenia purpurea var. burkii]